MEVTRLNFREALSVISQAINDASFLAIDAEFSGLTARRTENAQDTCHERYRKLHKGIKDFMILQFGICTFTWDEEQAQYIARPFNFYLFPKPFNRQMPDIRFICQSSSMDFLATQRFDFNKWVYQGIPFLLPSNKEKLCRILEGYRQQNENRSNTGSTENLKLSIPPEYEKTIEQIMKKVSNFIEMPDEKTLSLPPSSPFVRRLVYNSVYTAYTTGVHLESKVNDENQKYILVSKVTKEEKKCLQQEKNEHEHDDVEMAEGFSKVIRLISLSGKVVVAHNMMLDLMHTVRLFVSPLPEHLDSFKALLKGVFPKLVDTKLMSSTPPLQEHFTLTHLEEMYNTMDKEPFEKPKIVFPDEFNGYLENTKAHEAGYDAYITGVSFIAMVGYLEKLRDGHTPDMQLDFAVIKPFLNKIFLYPRIEDIPYLNLDGKDIMPTRDHVFYIECPSMWQKADIQALFKEFGYVYVTWLGGGAALVSVAKKERAAKVLDKLDIDEVPYSIMSYKEYCEELEEDKLREPEQHDEKDGERNSSLNRDHHISYQQTPPAKQETVPSNVPKQVVSSDSEIEEGEIPDSPVKEPPSKRLKGQHTYFDEPSDW